MIIKWKQAVLAGLEGIFSDKRKLKEEDDRELVAELYRQIGRLKVEVDFLKKRWEYLREEDNLKPGDLRLHIDKSINLPIAVQAELLGISRASIYYQRKEVSQKEVDLMNKIDAIYTDCPFYGSRKIAKELTKQLKFDVNRKRVQRLMRVMGIEAVYPKPNLSLNNTPHPIYPYLLKGLTITRPNQVWGADITYIRMEKGFLYLVAFMDWFSRYVVAWKLSNTLEATFCLEAAEEALELAIPEIVNFR